MDRANNAAKQWAKERPEIATEAMVLLGRLAEVTLIISRDYLNPFFAKYGLQPGEFDVIATLRRSGKPYKLTPTILYETAMISSGSMTNRINRLEKAGLVKRTLNPKDKRGFLIALTDKGFELIENMMQAYVDNQNRILAVLDVKEQQLLSTLLAKLVALDPNKAIE